MGALTLKNFPFVLRSWNVKSYESIDPTDTFGQSTKVYINKNQVVKIEPHFSNKASYVWLTDKGRQFFDSVFGKSTEKSSILENVSVKSARQWKGLFENINKTFYVLNICGFKCANRYFFIIVFENVSTEILNFLSFISQINSFIKIRRAEKVKVSTHLESKFQIDSATSLSKLSTSSLCLLIGTNSRYEGSYLNLKLRQRHLKGNFRLLTIGSLLDLTFPVSFLGSSVSSLRSVSEGNHVLCKDIINADNPMFITNSETFKHSNVQELLSILKVLKYSNVLNKVWNGYNVLNSSLYESGFYTFSRFSSLTLKDLTLFSSFYIINVNLNNVANLKVIMESRLLKSRSSFECFTKKLFMNQNFTSLSSSFTKFVKFKKYLYLPNSIFFENQETFINTEGYRKVGSKLIFKKNTKNAWQLLRKFVQNFWIHKDLNCLKENKILSYGGNTLFDFKNFINFHYQASRNLINLNDYIILTNQPFVLYKKFDKFKFSAVKLVDSKFKYWLDDFYTGGRDTFCQNSLTLIRCSANYRLQVTNFF